VGSTDTATLETPEVVIDRFEQDILKSRELAKDARNFCATMRRIVIGLEGERDGLISPSEILTILYPPEKIKTLENLATGEVMERLEERVGEARVTREELEKLWRAYLGKNGSPRDLEAVGSEHLCDQIRDAFRASEAASFSALGEVFEIILELPDAELRRKIGDLRDMLGRSRTDRPRSSEELIMLARRP
jgi:hypothetical protein